MKRHPDPLPVARWLRLGRNLILVGGGFDAAGAAVVGAVLWLLRVLERLGADR